MKRIFSMLVAAAALFTTSCSQDEPVNPSYNGGGNATVTFSASLPETIATRAFSDGLTAKNLTYAIYEQGSNEYVIMDNSKTFENLKATVEVQLVTGKTYDMFFWAQADNAPYTIDFATKSVTVNYAGALANDETRDAFYAFETFEITGPMNETIELRRPFAQINVGTNDLADAAKAGAATADLQSSMTIKGYTTLSLADGKVGNPVDVEFAMNVRPVNEKFPVEGYEYMEMNYVLVPIDKETVDCEIIFYDGTTALQPITLSNVPVQRNYRTNIYGSLLTDPTNFNVVINPEYNDPDYNVNYDGLTVENGVYTVTTANGLRTVAYEINKGTFAGHTIVLANNIDLAGAEWQPINLWNPENKQAILFDGNGMTISNMTVKGGGYLGFIGSIAATLTIEDLTFENPVVESTSSFVGTVIGYQYGDVTMNNVVVKGGVIETTAEKGIRVGGLVGFSLTNDGAKLALKNCKVENSIISGFHNLGGLVGTVMAAGATMTDCQSNNNTFYYGADNSGAWHDFDSNVYAEGKAEKENCTTAGNKGFKKAGEGVAVNGEGYQVYSAEGLAYIAANNAEFAGKTVILANDIDMEGVAYTPVPFWNPEKPMIFDGNTKTIRNISAPLFSTATMNVRNLNIEGGTIDATGSFVGAIVGNLYGNIDNCQVRDVTIKATGIRVGGLVGIHNSGNMSNCYAKNVNVTGLHSVAGLVGFCNETANRTYDNCVVEEAALAVTIGSGTGTKQIGAIVGAIDSSVVVLTLSKCQVANCTFNDSEEAPVNTLYGYNYDAKVVIP